MKSYTVAKRRILQAGETTQRLIASRRVLRGAGFDRSVQEPWHPDAVGRLQVPGEHNRANAALAAATAEVVGCDPVSIRAALKKFVGLPHRLRNLGTAAERVFVDDSQATSPEATIAALQVMNGNVRLICGGADKGAKWSLLANAIVKNAAAVTCYGATGPSIAEAVRTVSPKFLIQQQTKFNAACQRCWEGSQPGDTILLSPACSSFDQFSSCEQRGEAFARFFESLK